MAIVTSSDTDDSRKAAVAKHAGTAVVGYVAPWSTPARAVAKRVVRRRANQRGSKARGGARTKSWLPTTSKSSRFPGRAGVVVIALAGVVAGGVAFSAVRRARHTPPPVAAHPPRVEDVPTR